MNYTCCYQCEQRTLGCHDNCNNYTAYRKLNEREHEERRKYNESKFDISFDRVCRKIEKGRC